MYVLICNWKCKRHSLPLLGDVFAGGDAIVAGGDDILLEVLVFVGSGVDDI